MYTQTYKFINIQFMHFYIYNRMNNIIIKNKYAINILKSDICILFIYSLLLYIYIHILNIRTCYCIRFLNIYCLLYIQVGF